MRWLDRAIWSKINSDECRFGADGVLFPDRMKGKLEPTEWRPLMASSLIFQKILARNMPASFLVTIPLLFLATLIGAGIAMVSGGYEGIVFFLFVVLVDGPILVNGVTRARKKRRLEADLQATRIVGRDELLGVLKKIDGLGLDDVMKTDKRKLSSHFSSKPSVAERISNLSSRS